jgi:hypothetical protein
MSDPNLAPKPRNTPLVIGIIAGVVLLLLLCGGICMCGGCFSMWGGRTQEQQMPNSAVPPAQPD